EANRFLHRGVAFQDFVDLARGDLLPSPIDQLLYPTEKPQISAGSEAAQVPGSKPAIGERLGIRLRVVFVAVGDIRSADRNLTGLSWIQQASAVVEDRDAHARTLPHRARKTGLGWQRVRGHLVA